MDLRGAMTEDRLPRRRDERGPAARSSLIPAPGIPDRSGRPGPSGSPSPPSVRLHEAGPLSYRDVLDRDECWAQLSDPVRQRLTDRVGPVLDWWAIQNSDGRVHAVVLGPAGLAIAEPTVNTGGAPAHRLQVFPLVPDSFRFLEVTQPPGSGARGGWRRSGGQLPGPAAGEPADVPGLDAEMLAFLGNLPARAQTFLQAPFAGRRRRVEYERYYLRTERPDAVELYVGCYLTDLEVLTFVSGYRHSAYGAAEELGGWRLTCRQAKLDRPGRR